MSTSLRPYTFEPEKCLCMPVETLWGSPTPTFMTKKNSWDNGGRDQNRMHAISTQKEFLGYMNLVLPPTEAAAYCPSRVLAVGGGSPHLGKAIGSPTYDRPG